ncbi:hypothetical protein HD806DRAFT_551256 [Xylariaceae sp. AK1471]|nr:hypothetical protein HD806DRAFT_551256 [Xylariaceae sp. AK1471]
MDKMKLAKPDYPQTWNPQSFEHNKAWEYKVQRAMKMNSRILLNSRADLAVSYRVKGRWKRAEWLELNILRQKKDLLGNKHPDTIGAMENLATTYLKQGHWRQAKDLQAEVVKARESDLGKDHRLTLLSLVILAAIYGCLQECRSVEDESWSVPNTPSTKEKLRLQSHRRQCRLKKAKDMLGSMLSSTSQTLYPQDIANIESLLGSVFYRQSRWEDCRQLEMGILDRRVAMLGAYHRDTLISKGNLALSLKAYDVRNVEEALHHEDEVLHARRQLLGSDHPETMTAMTNLARTYESLGGSNERSNSLWTELRNGERQAQEIRKQGWKLREKGLKRKSRLQVLQNALVKREAESSSVLETDITAYYQRFFG